MIVCCYIACMPLILDRNFYTAEIFSDKITLLFSVTKFFAPPFILFFILNQTFTFIQILGQDIWELLSLLSDSIVSAGKKWLENMWVPFMEKCCFFVCNATNHSAKKVIWMLTFSVIAKKNRIYVCCAIKVLKERNIWSSIIALKMLLQ